MKLNLKCLPCYVNQVVQVGELMGYSPRTKQNMLREALQAVSGFKPEKNAFYTFLPVQDVIRKYTLKKDPYADLKKESNRICLRLEHELKSVIDASSDRFQTALRIAIGGNIIDFIKERGMNEQIIRENIKKALDQELNQEKVKLLKQKIQRAGKILYIGDNAGEIVFDKLFIGEFDSKKVVFVVRGGPTLNDVTMDDARATGLDKLVRVITTGIDLPGAVVSFATDEFKQEFDQADLVISKGQGNYEALSQEDKDIFFLLKVKCPAISESFSHVYKIGDIVIDNSG